MVVFHLFDSESLYSVNHVNAAGSFPCSRIGAGNARNDEIFLVNGRGMESDKYDERMSKTARVGRPVTTTLGTWNDARLDSRHRLAGRRRGSKEVDIPNAQVGPTLVLTLVFTSHEPVKRLGINST